MIVAAEALADVAWFLAKFSQVLADAEATAGAGDDDGADVVGAAVLQRRRERLVRRSVEGVEHVRTVERDRHDGAVAGRLDLGHAREPKSRRGPTRRC